jgi:hypothetical protein
MHLVQLQNDQMERRVALVDSENLILLRKEYPSVYDLVSFVINHRKDLTPSIVGALTTEKINYDEVYYHQSVWRILPSIDHPVNHSACMVSGTGLTHKASATNRQKMHLAENDENLTDSMQMYLWGEERGKPLRTDAIGVQPEWFYKGNGSILRGHGQALQVPAYADDGGEEPEIAGIYVIAGNGDPYRIGFTIGNEFSDHVMEKKNYLYLAPSKLRQCSIGPELVLTNDFSNVSGEVKIIRGNEVFWSSSIASGEQNMAHSLSNLEHHHFKYEQHRIPGQVHVHFFGAADFSFGHGMKLLNGDIMEVQWDHYGRALRNRIEILPEDKSIQKVKSL